jgi:gas vesicle protein
MRNSLTDNNEALRVGGAGASNFVFLLAGCGIGATLALLFAPKSGRELRSDLSDITRAGYDETLELAHELKDRSAELYHAVRDSADRVYDVAATRLHLAERTLENAGDSIGQIANGEIGRKGNRSSSQKQTDTPPSTF